MKYPNLLWALADSRTPNYQAAHELDTSESRFSRAMRGLTEFTTKERQRLAELLDYPESWLFQEAQPPTRQEDDAVLSSVSAEVSR